jgi:hypothetical protein
MSLPAWSETDFYVEVVNDWPILWIRDLITDAYIGVGPEDWALDEPVFNDLVEQIVYVDNLSSLEVKGRYYPRSQTSYNLLRTLLPTIKPRPRRPSWSRF